MSFLDKYGFQFYGINDRLNKIEEWIDKKDKGAFKKKLSSNQKLLILEYLGVIDFLQSIKSPRISNEDLGVLLEAITDSGSDNLGKNINHVKLDIPANPQKTRVNVEIAKKLFEKINLKKQLQLVENDIDKLNKRNM